VFGKFLQSDSIRVMGDKATARETMKKAGVPTVPGSEGLIQVPWLDSSYSS
jgi:biotin carboxylase